jgi:Xaa-Pro dipeptidase
MMKKTMAESVPPSMFQEKMNVPEANYRTAIAIKHNGRMTEVTATFVLRGQDEKSAVYAAVCPRCGFGEIVVAVKLNPDGTFQEAPACPTLCIDCVHERPADFHQNFQAALRLALGELGVGGRLGIEGTGYPLGPLFQDSVCVEIEARLNRVRAIKCEAEKPLLRRAAETAAVGQNAFYKYLQPGRCELEVFNDIRREMEIFAGQRIAMAGDFVSGREQTSRVGGWPTARRIEAGDPVICDLSPRVGRYWGDSCASVVAGEAGSGFLKLFGAAKSALTHAVSVMRPGLRISDLDAQLREIVRREGFHYPHHSGHSIGTSVPEWPRIVPHEDSVLAEGMFMMVEPGAYDPGIGGARCEWTIEIVKGGCRVVAPFEHRPSC